MKKIILGLLIGLGLVIPCNASSFMKNGELKLVDDRPYIVRCIMGTEWIQYIERGSGRGDLYFPSGNPVQVFVNNKENNGIVTIPCEENK